MSKSLQTDISIVSLNQGRRSNYTPTVRVIEPAQGIAPAEGKGNLYILLEVDGSGPGLARLYRDLLGVLQETYYKTGADTKTGLTAAIRAAHAYLQQYNQHHRTSFTAGVTCLVATGSEIISAQAGPTILAVRSKAGLQWFSPLNDENYIPLGDEAAPSVEIGQVANHPGAIIVVMNSAWANYLEVPLMLEATAVPRARAVADQMAGIGINAREELNVLVVTLSEDETSQATASQVSTPTERSRPAATVAPSPSATVPAAPAVAEPEQEEVWEEAPEAEAPSPAVPAPRRAGGRSSVGSLVGRVRLPRLRVRRRADVTQPRPKRPPRRIPYVLGIVTLMALAVAVLTAGMWYLQGRQNAAYFEQFMKGATIQYEAGLAASDANQARQYFLAAEEQLDQAAQFAPDHPDITRLRNQIAEARARVNLVKPLLAGFDQPLIPFDPDASEPVAVLVNGLSIYILDTQRGVFERYQLDASTGDRLADDGGPELLLQTGVTVGGRRVGELAHAVWAPAMGNRTITGPLLLDRGNQLFSVTEGLGPTNVDLAPNEDLGFVAHMEFYAGNIYLLDSGNSQLWRYRPNGEDYSIEPEPYFPPEASVNLSNVIDIAIDGAVWLLHPNGTVLRYFAGIQEAFALDVVDPPFSEAVAIWANEAESFGGRLYVADAASNRILVFDKSGALLAQLMPVDHPSVLNDLRDLYIDEVSNWIYALTDHGLYQAPLPPIADEE
ncbi:MAG: hypothetical protein D6775_03375 [Caldilineae bacterium]|nr:MAG: hypothetical protein D6775_03375 [Caldilineae bacterium]